MDSWHQFFLLLVAPARVQLAALEALAIVSPLASVLAFPEMIRVAALEGLVSPLASVLAFPELIRVAALEGLVLEAQKFELGLEPASTLQ
jgi:hypothetical protein